MDLAGHERTGGRGCQTYEILNPMNGDRIDIEVDLVENEDVELYPLKD